MIDRKGRVGLGECTAFDTDWYLPETLGDDLRVLRETLAPRVIAGTYLHPREVAADLFSLEGAEAFPDRKSAGSGKSLKISVFLGGGLSLKKKKNYRIARD